MPLHSYAVLAAFILLAAVFTIQVVRIKHEGSDILGKPTIDKYYFYSGKTALFSTWVFFIVKACVPKLGYFSFADYISWIAAGILWAGAIVTAFAITGLGSSLKVGLPESATTLKTRGIYRLSRNPVYTGIFLIGIASAIYFPDLINLSFAVYGMYIHHQIIKGEEHFLSRRFGKEWEVYKSHVRRYL